MTSADGGRSGPNLLVPIDLRALVSAGDTATWTWADTTPRYELLDAGVTLADQLAPKAFAPRSTGPETGVHLHWAMPDALTHGVHDRDGTTYPLLPNRWLVTRLWDDRGTIRTRAWVVISDALSADDPGGSTPWPQAVDGVYRCAYLGKALELAEWDDADDGPPPTLTAVGPGDPLFAASYWSCRNVFALHDPLDDLPIPHPLTYVVAGWWSDPSTGPILGDGNWRARLRELRWSLAPDVIVAPGDTLLHGTLHGVRWQGPDTAGETGVPQGPVQVSIGNSTTEALAAQLAAQLPDRPDAERLLQAFLDGLLPQLEGPDGLMVLEELLHEGQFAPADGGTTWDIVPSPSSPEARTPDQDALTPLDAKLSDPLNALNQTQHDVEAARWELASLRAMLYATWHRKVQLDQAAWSSSPSVQDVTDYIDATLLPRIGAVRAVLETLEASLITALGDTRRAVDLDGEHQLVELPRASFWQPRPPVAVLSGPGVERSYRHGYDGRHEADGTLRCRVSDTTIGGALPDCGPLPARLGADGPALLAEAAALSPDLPGDPRAGTPPSPAGVVAWAPPWTPLLMQWEAQWRPTAAKPADALDGWQLEAIDFRWAGGNPFRAPALRYGGQAPLDPATSIRLSDRIDRYLADHPDDPLRGRLTALAAAVGELNVVSQSLSGFNWALLGTVQTLQMPVIDRLDPPLGRDVALHITAEDEITPDPSGGFQPLRAGNLLLSRLAIVDTFGQVKPAGIEAGEAPAIVAESLRARVAPDYAELPPRISQPARLRFEWQPAQPTARVDDVTSDARTSPVAGWLLPNHLDASLMLYDRVGALLGELQLIDGALDPSGPGVRWLPAVGRPQTVGAPPDLRDPTLTAFVAGLMTAGQQGGHALRDLLATVDETLPTVDALGAWKDQSLSILVGRPLALARATVRLELQGPPASALSWPALQRQIEGGGPSTGGFTNVPLPVVLGDTRRLADGLIGFFAGDDFERFYLAQHAAVPPSGSTYVARNAPLHVTSDPAAAAIEVALVLDPRAAVHASCALLPTDSLSLASAYCAAAQAAMEVTFLVGPIISDAARVSLPVPASPGDWAWHSLRSSGEWRTVTKLDPVDTNASLAPEPQTILDGWLSLTGALTGGQR